MRAIAALLALAVASALAAPAAAAPPPAGFSDGASLVVKVQQRAPRGGAGNPGASDHTAATSDVYSFQPVSPPSYQSPVGAGGDGRAGRTQYGCLSSVNGWSLYSDGLGNQNFSGGTCTFVSPEVKTAGCPEGCGTYTYNDLWGISMPGGNGYNAGTRILNRNGCYSPIPYQYPTNCNCGSYTDNDGNNVSYCDTCYETAYTCNPYGAM